MQDLNKENFWLFEGHRDLSQWIRVIIKRMAVLLGLIYKNNVVPVKLN